jgi:hypothetical protein
MYGKDAAGYGTTNALLAMACVAALFWFVRELTDRPAFACAAASLFALWHLRPAPFNTFLWLAGLASFCIMLGALLPGRRLLPNLLAALVASVAVEELYGSTFLFGESVVRWLPGRTASSMTFFALIALASYARFERLGARRKLAAPSSLDLPATKSTSSAGEASRFTVFWAVVACLATLLALGCYEQAVMIPAALFGVAVAFRMRGFAVRWGWQAAFWSLLIGYLALRYALVPMDASGYQRQQFRTGPGVWISISNLLFPCIFSLHQFATTLESGWFVLMFTQTYQTLWTTMGNVAVAAVARRKLALVLVGWVLSVLTFLPMAWLKSFYHYYYLPATFRAILAVVLVVIAGELAVIAWSRPGRQAPARLDPAPGSLLRP